MTHWCEKRWKRGGIKSNMQAKETNSVSTIQHGKQVFNTTPLSWTLETTRT